MGACASPHTGPKRIEADGTTYIACGGATWIPSAKDTPYDNTPRTYDVFFKNTEGADRELKHVRTLRVTDLPDGTPECGPGR
jgi:hypothetical protein